MPTYVTALVIAYLFGSIPFGYLLVRFARKEDIRSVGSGNIGATNVLRSGSKGLGLATLLLDLGKGCIAVWFAGHLAAHAGLIDPFQLKAIAAAVVTAAHVYPVWLGFRGGKGVATALGVFLALSPWAAISLLGVFIVIFAVSRIVSLASIIAAASFFVLGPLLAPAHVSRIALVCLCFIPILIIVKHHQNIGRLMNGTEPRFGKSKKVNA